VEGGYGACEGPPLLPWAGASGCPNAPKSGVPGGTPPGTADTGMKAVDDDDETGWKTHSLPVFLQLVHFPSGVFW